MIKNVLFDLDGTLTDPKLGITNCIRYAMEKMGREDIPSNDQLIWCIGPPLLSSFGDLLETDDKAVIDQAITFYRERFSTIGMLENDVIPGIPELLRKLQQRGLRLFVATSKPHHYANQIIEHFNLEEHFEQTFGSEMDGTNSYKPDLLKRLLEDQELEAGQSIMIGDRHHDIDGARANGIHSIAVTWGYGSETEFATANPDHICRHPQEIVAVISSIGVVLNDTR